MASRRQDAWEVQLKEKAFLTAMIKPIVDDISTFKPPVPYALREVKRSMDKGVYFKDNTYEPAGIPRKREVASTKEKNQNVSRRLVPRRDSLDREKREAICRD